MKPLLCSFVGKYYCKLIIAINVPLWETQCKVVPLTMFVFTSTSESVIIQEPVSYRLAKFKYLESFDSLGKCKGFVYFIAYAQKEFCRWLGTQCTEGDEQNQLWCASSILKHDKYTYTTVIMMMSLPATTARPPRKAMTWNTSMQHIVDVEVGSGEGNMTEVNCERWPHLTRAFYLFNECCTDISHTGNLKTGAKTIRWGSSRYEWHSNGPCRQHLRLGHRGVSVNIGIITTLRKHSIYKHSHCKQVQARPGAHLCPKTIGECTMYVTHIPYYLQAG
jgi:hypothetical protein